LGTLYVVGTPIGNLEDLSPRAARVFAEVGLVAAEDTRRTMGLLTHLGLRKRMVSLHADVERARARGVVAELDSIDVAFCTDGGMPAISDPGAHLVELAREAGHAVVVVPGPSAVTAALAISGMNADRFIFLGFLPRKGAEMTRLMEGLREDRNTLVALESPQRLLKSLDIIAATLPERRCAVARELTKVHEELRVGTAAELAAHYRAHPPRGEITLVVAGAAKKRNAVAG
jgi:16S rRNA (cytidine1402-2'-O)-methyltransferase